MPAKNSNQNMSHKANDIFNETAYELANGAYDEDYQGEDCVCGSPEKHTEEEWNEIINNLKL